MDEWQYRNIEVPDGRNVWEYIRADQGWEVIEERYVPGQIWSFGGDRKYQLPGHTYTRLRRRKNR
jgi:hypothetical protein